MEQERANEQDAAAIDRDCDRMVEEVAEYLQTEATTEDVKRVYAACGGTTDDSERIKYGPERHEDEVADREEAVNRHEVAGRLHADTAKHHIDAAAKSLRAAMAEQAAASTLRDAHAGRSQAEGAMDAAKEAIAAAEAAGDATWTAESQGGKAVFASRDAARNDGIDEADH